MLSTQIGVSTYFLIVLCVALLLNPSHRGTRTRVGIKWTDDIIVMLSRNVNSNSSDMSVVTYLERKSSHLHDAKISSFMRSSLGYPRATIFQSTLVLRKRRKRTLRDDSISARNNMNPLHAVRTWETHVTQRWRRRALIGQTLCQMPAFIVHRASPQTCRTPHLDRCRFIFWLFSFLSYVKHYLCNFMNAPVSQSPNVFNLQIRVRFKQIGLGSIRKILQRYSRVGCPRSSKGHHVSMNRREKFSN